MQEQYAATLLVDTLSDSADKLLHEVAIENEKKIKDAEAKFSETVTEILTLDQLAVAIGRLQSGRMRGLFFVNYSWANTYFELSNEEVTRLRAAERRIRMRVDAIARKQMEDGVPLVPSESTKRFIDESLLLAIRDINKDKIIEIWKSSSEVKEEETWDEYWARQNISQQNLKDQVFGDKKNDVNSR
jgi:hypothetical protein